LAVRRGRAEAQRLSIRRDWRIFKTKLNSALLCFIFIKRVRFQIDSAKLSRMTFMRPFRRVARARRNHKIYTQICRTLRAPAA
jgi:hypothetical protein